MGGSELIHGDTGKVFLFGYEGYRYTKDEGYRFNFLTNIPLVSNMKLFTRTYGPTSHLILNLELTQHPVITHSRELRRLFI